MKVIPEKMMEQLSGKFDTCVLSRTHRSREVDEAGVAELPQQRKQQEKTSVARTPTATLSTCVLFKAILEKTLTLVLLMTAIL